MSIAKQLDQTGWRQGSLVGVENHERFEALNKSISPGDRLIVISQSCDIIKQPDDAEPFVELIIARPLRTLEGNFTHNKNARLLHLNICTHGGEEPYELLQINKFSVEKNIFDGLLPDENVFIEGRDVAVMARWCASRYSRPAFPNAFNERVAKSTRNADKKIIKAAKKLSQYVSAIYLQISPSGEARPEEAYSVNLLALLVPDSGLKVADPEITEPIQALVDILMAAGMDVTSAIRSEDKVPYSILHSEYKAWSFDHVSLRNDPVHELVPVN